MIRPLIIAIAMALPLLAQEPTSSEPQDTPPPPPQGGAVAPHGDPHHAAFMEKFDTNKDGRIDEKEKEAIRTASRRKFWKSTTPTKMVSSTSKRRRRLKLPWRLARQNS